MRLFLLMQQPILLSYMARISILISTIVLLTSCSSSVNFTETFKQQTAGKYLFNADDIMQISYEGNDLFIKWRGVKTQPVVTDTNEFFIPDLYRKLQFVIHPETKKRYLSIVSEEKTDQITYDYLKVADDYKTPSQWIEAKNFDKALEGLLAIKAQDSMSDFINQYKFNRIGYRYLREKNYEDAIGIFIMNTKLHPNSGNVYDSLADAYLRSGDSVNAYTNYKKAFSINGDNRKAKEFIESYSAEN